MASALVANYSQHERMELQTNRFGYSLPPTSCEGEPAPIRELPFRLPVIPNGERDEPGVCSIGEVLDVEEPERGWVAVTCGR